MPTAPTKKLNAVIQGTPATAWPALQQLMAYDGSQGYKDFSVPWTNPITGKTTYPQSWDQATIDRYNAGEQINGVVTNKPSASHDELAAIKANWDAAQKEYDAAVANQGVVRSPSQSTIVSGVGSGKPNTTYSTGMGSSTTPLDPEMLKRYYAARSAYNATLGESPRIYNPATDNTVTQAQPWTSYSFNEGATPVPAPQSVPLPPLPTSTNSQSQVATPNQNQVVGGGQQVDLFNAPITPSISQPVNTTLSQMPNVLQNSMLNKYVASSAPSKSNAAGSTNMALADLGNQANNIWKFKGFDTQSGLQGGTQNWSDLMNL